MQISQNIIKRTYGRHKKTITLASFTVMINCPFESNHLLASHPFGHNYVSGTLLWQHYMELARLLLPLFGMRAKKRFANPINPEITSVVTT